MLPVYQTVVRTPKVLKTRNPLAQTSSVVISLAQRLAELNSFKQWQKLMDEYRAKGIKLNPKLRPMVKMVKLGYIKIDVDIQRALDTRHCVKIANPDNFDERLLQVVYCIKTPGSDDDYHAVDGQHTATDIAALVDAGMFAGETDWREVEVPVLYIETTSKSFARKAFALINGKGKKKISPWYDYRSMVMSVRIDCNGDATLADPEDAFAYKTQLICEEHEIYPVDKESNFVNFPGATTHPKVFSLDHKTLDMACKWHNNHWHFDIVDGSLWFMVEDIKKSFDAAKLKVTDKFLKELAGIIQAYFGGLHSFHDAVHGAHNRWGEHRYGYEVSWDDSAIASTLVILYQRLGGTQAIPLPLTDKFDHILDFLDDDIKTLVGI
jgi:hypothetical protein